MASSETKKNKGRKLFIPFSFIGCLA